MTLGLPQVVEPLCSYHKVLSTNLSSAENTQEQQQQNLCHYLHNINYYELINTVQILARILT
jgi:hypothetical protein